MAPELYKDKKTKQYFPVEPLTPGGKDLTAYLDIDLKIPDSSVLHMTAVFAPDPTVLSGPVDILLWLHGDKAYWKNGEKAKSFAGESIEYYLTKLPMCNLRDFILQTKKKKFLLVAPTMTDSAQAVRFGDGDGGALGWKQAKAEEYLKQVLEGVKEHMGVKKELSIGKIVLAAHSGGGFLQAQMAQNFAGEFDKMNEIWCFDSTYFGYEPLIKWIQKGHTDAKLWIYSTGGKTGKWASYIMKLNPPTPRFKPKPVGKSAGTITKAIGAVTQELGELEYDARLAVHALAVAQQTTKIDVMIDGRDPPATDFFMAAYAASPGGHYESIPQFLTKLVQNSQNLK